MSTNRLFNLFIIAVLLSLTVLTVRQAWATVQVAPGSIQGSGISAQAEAQLEKNCPFSAAEMRSLRAEYHADKGPWIARSASGPSGPQGGVLALLNCSK